jgi:broad specificity phosphatase PhoE
MIIVQFVRHAQSISNAGLPTDHPASIPLTETGLEQARLLSLAIEPAPDLIVTSAYLRTQTSALPLKERFPLAEQAVWPLHEFTYMNPINWHGTTGKERTPSAHAFWARNDPFYRDGGGAESFADLMDRIEQVRQLILQRKDSQIVVFSHGLFTRAFWWRMNMLQQPINADGMRRCVQFLRGIPLANCAILNFKFEEQQIWVSGPHTGHMPPELITD